MLIEFRVKNYKSFKDWQTLSMVASADKSLPDNTTTVESLGNRRLVRSAVVYGANASGKSNLVDALGFVLSFVADSTIRNPGAEIPAAPFLLSENSAIVPSEFEISFIRDGVRYQYGFSVDRQRVYEEWLIAYPKGKAQTWFERPVDNFDNPAHWYFGPKLKGEKKRLVSLVRQDTLFLSVAAQFSHKQLETVYNWFKYQIRVIRPEMPVRGKKRQIYTARFLHQNHQAQETILSFLKKADLGISEIIVETKPIIETNSLDQLPDEIRPLFEQLDKYLKSAEAEAFSLFEQPDEYLKVQMRHQTKEDKPGVVFPYKNESRGTRRVFILIGPWIHTLIEGFTIVVDELESSLHPMLARMLIEMFHNSKVNNNAQLIFNTHNTTLLDNELFRRDQIWFVEKDEGGASRLYPLLEFSPRKDEALAKGYLQGRYGAIPFLGSLEGFVLDGKT